MGNVFRKIKKKNNKKLSKKSLVQNKKIHSLLGASDSEIDDFFDNEFDGNLYKPKTSKSKSLQRNKLVQKNKPVLADPNYLEELPDGSHWCTKKYKITRKYLRDGSQRYFFDIVDSRPYVRKRFRLLRPNLTCNKLRNKELFEILKNKNLYYLKKPFEQLILFIAPVSLRVLMNCVYTGERLYMRSAIEFYLQKYQISFKRYKDDSKFRVRKHRNKLK